MNICKDKKQALEFYKVINSKADEESIDLYTKFFCSDCIQKNRCIEKD